jgi:UrcA family protein
MIKTLTALSSLLFVTMTCATPASARGQDAGSIRVGYADLNLRSDEGRGALQRRIANAAKVVCVIEDTQELALRTSTRNCRTAAVDSARPAYDAAVAAARGSVTVSETAAAAIVVSGR